MNKVSIRKAATMLSSVGIGAVMLVSVAATAASADHECTYVWLYEWGTYVTSCQDVP